MAFTYVVVALLAVLHRGWQWLLVFAAARIVAVTAQLLFLLPFLRSRQGVTSAWLVPVFICLYGPLMLVARCVVPGAVWWTYGACASRSSCSNTPDSTRSTTSPADSKQGRCRCRPTSPRDTVRRDATGATPPSGPERTPPHNAIGGNRAGYRGRRGWTLKRRDL